MLRDTPTFAAAGISSMVATINIQPSTKMPLPLTHAVVPIAGAIAFSPRPIPWRLILVAGIAAMAPDIDSLPHPLLGVASSSIYSHRGMGHSLLMALAVGALVAAFHRSLRVSYLTAAIVIAGAAASHGLLDMMTDSGRPVAYLWPLSSARLFADWRPIHSIPIHRNNFLALSMIRLGSELRQVVVPMILVAVAIRIAREGTKVSER
jgi:inner membrane protein